MIQNYKIKNIDGKEVIYIYLNFNYEIGSFNLKDNNLIKSIKKYIKERKIAFKGTIAIIVASGMVTGCIYLKKPKQKKSVIKNNQIVEKIDVESQQEGKQFIYNDYEIDLVEGKEESKNVENFVPNEESKMQSKNTENVVQNEEKIEANIQDKVENNTIYENVNNEDNDAENVEKVFEETNNYVTIYRSNGEVLNLELEEYIVGVVGAEMPAAFHSEALKTQAVLARTYALKAINSGKTLTDNESTQSFKDSKQLRSMWGSSFDTYYQKIFDAVNSTKGEYLTYNGDYIEAVYHSTSNGYTESSLNVWGNYYSYLVSVESSYDNLNPSFNYEKKFSFEELSSRLNIQINIDSEFNIISRTESGRVSEIKVNNNLFSGTKFRSLLGLRSTDFDIEKFDSGIKFTTRGYGHGVGMSQYGANGYAKNGYSYINILYHYYPGTLLKK